MRDRLRSARASLPLRRWAERRRDHRGEIAPAPGASWALRYTATRGDLDLDVIETDVGTLGFGERRGLDATSLVRLDDFQYAWLTLVPGRFGSLDDELVVELHFPVRPRFVELRDIHGVGLRMVFP